MIVVSVLGTDLKLSSAFQSHTLYVYHYLFPMSVSVLHFFHVLILIVKSTFYQVFVETLTVLHVQVAQRVCSILTVRPGENMTNIIKGILLISISFPTKPLTAESSVIVLGGYLIIVPSEGGFSSYLFIEIVVLLWYYKCKNVNVKFKPINSEGRVEVICLMACLNSSCSSQTSSSELLILPRFCF